jgi:hypothetical protein
MAKGKWDIEDLELFFREAELPSEPIRMDECTVITDVSLFINSHLSYVRAQNGNDRYLPYLERLQELKKNLTNKSKLI